MVKLHARCFLRETDLEFDVHHRRLYEKIRLRLLIL
jgi:hypothetical protein